MADELSIQRLRSIMETGPARRSVEINPSTPKGAAAGSTATPSFADTLQESLAEVNALRNKADQAMQDIAVGKTTDVQGTIIAMEKADVSFRMMMEARNKLLSAYQEIMRTQV